MCSAEVEPPHGLTSGENSMRADAVMVLTCFKELTTIFIMLHQLCSPDSSDRGRSRGGRVAPGVTATFRAAFAIDGGTIKLHLRPFAARLMRHGSPVHGHTSISDLKRCRYNPRDCLSPLPLNPVTILGVMLRCAAGDARQSVGGAPSGAGSAAGVSLLRVRPGNDRAVRAGRPSALFGRD